MLNIETDLLREQFCREHDTVTDLCQRLNQSENERRRTSNQLTVLLTHQQEQQTTIKAPVGRFNRAWTALTGKL